MEFYSTNNRNLRVDLRQAVMQGLAPDNGLYMPVSIPKLPDQFFRDISRKTFQELSLEEKKEFLNYSVTVKDMKDIGMDIIKEIFKRINSTDYSLNANEVINAQFGDGEFAIFCKQVF